MFYRDASTPNNRELNRNENSEFVRDKRNGWNELPIPGK